jgi:hypothetical protein
MTLADVARAAAVSRSAVSNWRNRYADFPQPTGGTTRQPTFDRDAMETWLDRRSHTVAASGATNHAGRRPPPRMAKELLALLEHVERRRPGAWLLHEEILDRDLATAPLIRQLAASGHVERGRIALDDANRVLVRLSRSDELPVDVEEVQRLANEALAAVGHQVAIHRARSTGRHYTAAAINHRGMSFTSYTHTRTWEIITSPVG